MIDLPVMPDEYRPGIESFSKTFDSPAPDWRAAKLEEHAGKGVSAAAEDILPKATVEEIRAALSAIPANCGEDVWWRIAAALFNHFGGTEEGFALFHEWSKTGGDSYKGEADCRKKWEHSAKKTDIRIATLFHYANEYDAGWRDKDKAPEPETEEPEAEAEEPPIKDEWPILDEAAYHGLAGKIVKTIEPHSEGDPVAILVQLLVAVGSAAGRMIYVKRESTRHYPNLFASIVGNTALARKGTALGRVLDVMYRADSKWKLKCVSSGLSSGEGLIDRVRDPRTKTDKDGKQEVIDAGVEDKRLAVIESEFAAILAVMERAGNTISPVIRCAWDGGDLEIMTRKNPLKATSPHISVIAHITIEELRSRLTKTDAASGFANRFIFILARRSKLLPMGGDLSEDEITNLGSEVTRCLGALFDEAEAKFSEAAEKRWIAAYLKLNEEERPGMLGAVTSRGSAQVLRIALVYAILDARMTIEVEHIEAALAVWRYAEASARIIFGDMLGDNTADTILMALRQVHPAGLNRTEISNLFANHARAADLLAALTRLKLLGLARAQIIKTPGRSTETWFYASPRR